MTTKLVRRKDLTELAYRLRRSYLITLTAVILALGTVAVWSGTQAFFFTFIGMGVALATSAPRTDTAHASIMEAVAAKRSPRFSRGPAEVPAGAVAVPSMAEAEPEPRYSRSRKIIIPRYRQRGPAE